jgi:enamine deaminase RidA (YjgF/YER057c/UK114 family)
VTLQLINPEDLPIPSTYTHVVVATGTKMVFIAGQEPEDGGNVRSKTWTPRTRQTHRICG